MTKHLLALSVGVLLAIGANAQNTNSSGQNNGQGIVHWKLDGNTANDNHFIGTVNEKPLVFKANSLEGIRLLTDGSIRLEQLKQQPNENTLGLPRVMVIKEDGTMAILTGEELASKIWFDVPNALECPQDNNGDKLVNWRPLKGQPAKLVAYSKCAGDVHVGINTENPQYALDVNGTSSFSQAMRLRTNLNALYKPFFISSNTGEEVFRVMGDGTTIIKKKGTEDYSYAFMSIVNNTNQKGIAVINETATNWSEVFRVMGDGAVFAKSIELCGLVKSNEVRVETEGWCDYVFEESYQRMTIEEKEKFVKENKHLPMVTPQAEIEEKGLNVGENMKGFVYNLENLTLDQIELYKMIQELKKEQEILKQKIEQLEEENKQLKN